MPTSDNHATADLVVAPAKQGCFATNLRIAQEWSHARGQGSPEIAEGRCAR